MGDVGEVADGGRGDGVWEGGVGDGIDCGVGDGGGGLGRGCDGSVAGPGLSEDGNAAQARGGCVVRGM